MTELRIDIVAAVLTGSAATAAKGKINHPSAND
jgi:hypothetical protein